MCVKQAKEINTGSVITVQKKKKAKSWVYIERKDCAYFEQFIEINLDREERKGEGK